MRNAPAYRMHTRNVDIARISQNFVEKTFTNGSKTAKNAKVFCYRVKTDLYTNRLLPSVWYLVRCAASTGAEELIDRFIKAKYSMKTDYLYVH